MAPIAIANILWLVILLCLLIFPKPRKYFPWLASLPCLPFHFLSLVCEIALISVLSSPTSESEAPSYGFLFVPALVIFLCDFSYNFICSSLLLFATQMTIWKLLLSYLLSIFHVSNFNVAFLLGGTDLPSKKIAEAGYSLQLNRFWKNLSFLIIAILSLQNKVTSILPLIVLVFELQMLFWDLAIEMTQLFLTFFSQESLTELSAGNNPLVVSLPHPSNRKARRSGKPTKENTDNMKVEVDDRQASGNDTTKNTSKEAEKILTWVFGSLLFPLVLLTFLPHFLSLIGAPLGFTSLRRFLCFWEGREELKKKDKPLIPLSRMAARGCFLLPLNLVVLTPVMIFFFIINFMVIMPLYMLRLLTKEDKIQLYINTHHEVYRFILGCLLWAFFPFLDQPPKLKTSKEINKRPFILMAAFVLWFLSSNFVFPIVDSTFDFIFSFSLLEQSQDPLLPREELDSLLPLLRSSFFFSVFGTLMGVLRAAFLVYIFLKPLDQSTGGGLFRLYAFCIDPVDELSENKNECSSTNQRKKRRANTYLSLNLLLAGDALAQVVIKIFSVSYVGVGDVFWIITLALSILGFSFALAFQLTKIVAKKSPGWFRGTTTVWFFLIIAPVLSALSGVFVNSRFCTIPKTLDTASEVSQIASCSSLEFPFRIANTPRIVQPLLLASSIKEVEVSENPDLLSLAFPMISELSRNFSASFNPIMEELLLTSLRTMPEGVLFSLSKNSALTSLRLESLLIQKGKVELEGNSLSSVVFPNLQDLQGEVLLNNNAVPLALVFSKLSRLQGGIVVENNTLSEVAFPLLTGIEEGAHIRLSNSALPETVVFSSNVFLNGHLEVSNSTGIRSLVLPKTFSLLGVLHLTGLSDFTQLDISGVETLEGELHLIGNDALSTLSFPGLLSISFLSDLQIVENPSLTTLEFPDLESVDSALRVSNNPNLVLISFPKLQDPLSNRFFENNNPNVQILYGS